jgi:phosphoglycolate phosphatase-like HAD superfamily hydrolase
MISAPQPAILALDFDGVLCDGMQEYFATAWTAYCRIWQPASDIPPEGLADVFARLRPVIETGWEMPLVIWATLQGTPEQAILADWPAIAQQLLTEQNLDAATMAATLDGSRDEWIAKDLLGWLAKHRFYPGVLARLQQALSEKIRVVIISTKEGRFIKTLLQQGGLEPGAIEILGKEVKRPKHQTLRELLHANGAQTPIWFVEDRFKTLQGVEQHTDLANIQLFLADWGYNTAPERADAVSSSRIHLISLNHFGQDFPAWLGG